MLKKNASCFKILSFSFENKHLFLLRVNRADGMEHTDRPMVRTSTAIMEYRVENHAKHEEFYHMILSLQSWEFA